MLFCAICAFVAVQMASAQPGPQGGRTHRHGDGKAPVMMSQEDRAKMQADEMRRELNLDDKQYKKVYRFLLREIQNREAQRPSGFDEAGGPGMGGPSGMPPGGMPMGGGFGGPGGGRPDGNMPPRGERPDMQAGPDGPRVPGMTPGQMEKARAKKEKHFKKILTEEQFRKWSAMQHRKDFGEPRFD